MMMTTMMTIMMKLMVKKILDNLHQCPLYSIINQWNLSLVGIISV